MPRKVEFIESYVKVGNDYQWNDNHGELIRCKDCKYVGTDATCCLVCNREGMGLRPFHVYHDDYCTYAEPKETGE